MEKKTNFLWIIPPARTESEANCIYLLNFSHDAQQDYMEIIISNSISMQVSAFISILKKGRQHDYDTVAGK